MYTQMKTLEIERAKEEQRWKQLEDELTNVDCGNEGEVELRVQFEGKLNEMYSKQREIELKIK